MKKKRRMDKSMKKNNFVQGAFVATLGVVLTKILGILYVIPFHAIIGEQGGALYGYAYNIYLFFMAISTAGIPLAISKIISEYQTLGYYDAKQRAFKTGKYISLILGFICFIVLFIFAPQVAHAILGDLEGGNTIEQVTFVIRVISTAIIIVPVLSVYRGYFEGHKFITPTATSQVLEQIVRVTFIIAGSYLCLRVFNLSLTTAVGAAVFGATMGALASYIYLIEKKRKNIDKFTEKPLDVKEPKISTKEILYKVFWYSLPFIMIDIFKSLYNVVDTTTVVKTLAGSLNYTTQDAETIMAIISTWGTKFNMIVISISTGLIVSLIPNITSSYVVGNTKDVHRKINQTFQILIFLTVPMTIGLSFLAEPVWQVFYGASKYGASVLSYLIFVALATCLFTTAITITQVLKSYKAVFISLFVGLSLKILLNTGLMAGFYKMGLPAYYGAITSTIIGYGVSFVICLVAIKKKCGVKYETTVKQTLNVCCGAVLMVIGLLLVRLVVPIVVDNRFLNIFIIAIYAIIGMAIYFAYMWKTNSIQTILGDNLLKKFMLKIKK